MCAFAAGFIVRPFGALVFGRIGDLVGRKNTFLVTMVIMGLSTTGDIYAGLWYPVGFASVGALVVLFLMPETKGRPIED